MSPAQHPARVLCSWEDLCDDEGYAPMGWDPFETMSVSTITLQSASFDLGAPWAPALQTRSFHQMDSTVATEENTRKRPIYHSAEVVLHRKPQWGQACTVTDLQDSELDIARIYVSTVMGCGIVTIPVSLFRKCIEAKVHDISLPVDFQDSLDLPTPPHAFITEAGIMDATKEFEDIQHVCRAPSASCASRDKHERQRWLFLRCRLSHMLQLAPEHVPGKLMRSFGGKLAGLPTKRAADVPKKPKMAGLDLASHGSVYQVSDADNSSPRIPPRMHSSKWFAVDEPKQISGDNSFLRQSAPTMPWLGAAVVVAGVAAGLKIMDTCSPGSSGSSSTLMMALSVPCLVMAALGLSQQILAFREEAQSGLVAKPNNAGLKLCGGTWGISPLEIVIAEGTWEEVSELEAVILRQGMNVVSDDTADEKLPCAEKSSRGLSKAFDTIERYVQACGGDQDEAKTRWNQTLNFRAANNLDGILWQPQVYFSLFKEVYPHGVFSCSKEGLPVYIEKPGSLPKAIQTLRAKNVDPEMLVRHFLFISEYMWRIQNPDVFPRGYQIKIIDASGLGLSSLGGEPGSLAKEMSRVVGDYWPERSYKIIIVNAGRMFSMLWASIKSLISENTRAKIYICGSGKEACETLKQWIDEDQIPAEYGGKATHSLSSSKEEKALMEFVLSHNGN